MAIYYTAQQVSDLVYHAQKAAKNDAGIALWYDPDFIDPKKNLPKVWFAIDGGEDNSPYSATVNLLQYLLGHIKADTIKSGVMYRSSRCRYTKMCEGMMKFHNLQFGTSHTNLIHVSGIVNVNPDLFTPSKTIYPGNPINDAEIKNRDALDAFSVPVVAAPLPDVDVTREDWLIGSKGFNTIHRIYMMAAFALMTKRFGTTDNSGHNIAAILVDKTGHILSWGLNQRWNNATFHAEVNMLQAYYKNHKADPGLPDGARIYTTLKPCKMCAGMIREAAKDINTVAVYYGQNDPGALDTALDEITTSNVQRSLNHSKHVSHNFYSGTNLAQLLIDRKAKLKSINIASSPDKILEKDMMLYMHKSKAAAHTSYLTEFLKTSVAVEAIKSARQSLVSKFSKYKTVDDPPALNPNVLNALKSVLPLLQAQNIHGFQDISW